MKKSSNGLPRLSAAELAAVDLVRKKGPLSRTAIAEYLEISRGSVTAIAGNLVDLNVLTEVGHGKSEGGRRPRLLDVNAELGYIAGVDIGATSVDLALADFQGSILERKAEPADVREEPDQVLDRIIDLIVEMLSSQGAEITDLVGLGIGVPGPVQFPAGLLIEPPLMPAWDSFPIKRFIRQRIPQINPVVDNDVNIMAIGEARVGGGKGLDNFFYIKIGTGIGCGVINNGHIYRGSDGTAGDVGHICVDYNGPICHCGNTGCLESMAAGPAIAQRGREAAESGESEIMAKRLELNRGELTSKDVGEAAAAGDQAANRIINESGRMIGGVLAGLVNFYNPRAIFIGGGVSNIGHQLLSTIRQATLRRATALSTSSLLIDYSKLGSDAGVHGAIWIAIENVFVSG
ncbi:MAG: ROK family transcriptional regulator [Desulfobacteraceae bacterium]|nr:ROK family transcriptional regulator [Desulfobacteraceae bacterium]